MATKKRKSIAIHEEAVLTKQRIDVELKRLKEIEEVAKQAQEEEINIVNDVRSKIDKLCKENGLKCELQLTIKDALAIVELFVTSKQPIVTVGYGLYYQDTTEEDSDDNKIDNP